jgi:hypothetical protein
MEDRADFSGGPRNIRVFLGQQTYFRGRDLYMTQKHNIMYLLRQDRASRRIEGIGEW